jgi:hypothetical protein
MAQSISSTSRDQQQQQQQQEDEPPPSNLNLRVASGGPDVNATYTTSLGEIFDSLSGQDGSDFYLNRPDGVAERRFDFAFL